VLPEYFVHAWTCVLFLMYEQYVALSLNLPLLAYHIYRYSNRPRGLRKFGLYDPASISSARQIMWAKREGLIKAIFYMSIFFYYIFNVTYLVVVDGIRIAGVIEALDYGNY